MGAVDCSRYVETLIDAAAVRGSSSQSAGSVMCVIRRREDASALFPVHGGRLAFAANICDHVVFRLDSNFTIISECLLCQLSSAVLAASGGTEDASALF